MSRYFLSFIVSGVLYSALIVSLLFAVNNDEEKVCHKKMEHINKVAVSLIAQQAHAQKMPTPKKEVKKKTEPKKIVQKPKPKPIVKEIVKKEPIEKPKEVVKEVVEQEIVQEVVQEEVVDNQEMQRQMQQMMVLKEKELERFTQYLIKKINENKHYPMTARRREIEGDVDVKFVVMADGEVMGIEVLEGKRIFRKPTYRAIKDSFPVDVSNTVLEFPHEFQIKLVYQLVK